MSGPPPYDLKNEEEAKEYLNNIGIEYHFQCHHEKDPDGCHRLADFMESVRRDEVQARKLFKMNCEKNQHGHSCFKHGQQNMAGIGGPKDYYEAFKYFVRGCDASYGPACHNAGLLHHLGRTCKRDVANFRKAEEFVKKGCELKNLPSCHFLSTYYLTGQPDVPKDLPKAFELAKSSCDAGHTNSCVHVSIMYKNGDGVEKNMELSKKYKQFAKKLHRGETALM